MQTNLPISRLAFAPPNTEPPGDLLIVVFQRGAMDGLNAVLPHAESEYYNLRPTLAIPEPKSGDDQTALDLDGFFALHPALRPFMDLWDEKALAIVHAVGSPDPTHSHFDAMDYMERGTPGDKAVATGWIGRHLQTAPWQNETPFRAVGMGGMLPTSLRGPVPVTTLKSIADFHLQGQTSRLSEIQQTLLALYQSEMSLHAEAASAFNAIDLLAKVDVSTYTPSAGALYPETDYGLALKQVAQIAKAEIGLEVACIDLGGWDTHNAEGQLEGELPTLLAEFAGGLSALYRDLGERAKRTTVVSMSEFGRRAYENGSGGTDHGHGNCMFVLGGGVNGGQVYGPWPTLAKDALYGPGDLAITTDFRTVLGEIVTKRLKNPAVGEVFPDFEGQALGVVKD